MDLEIGGIQLVVANGRFKICKKIGKGVFGDIYQGVILEPEQQRNQEVAIKLENINNKNQQLLFEAKLYRILQHQAGIPIFHWFGREGEFNILVIDLLGPSLEDLFVLTNKKFSLQTVIMIEDQIITTIESMHTNNFLHRDIKPENFLIGLGKKADQIFTIDFGLSRKFRDPRTGLHIPYTGNKSLTGTARYASISTHLGIEQSRRDDLESIGYALMYFLRGDLPWMGLKAETKKEKYQLIREKKISTPLDVLCKGYPEEFSIYLKYCRALKFEEKPDYVLIRRLFKDLYYKLQPTWDYIFDWAQMCSNKRAKENEERKKQQQQAQIKQK